MTLVLASGSPRRRELLAGLGLTFDVRPVAIDESPRAGEDPETYVRRLAVEKAQAGAALAAPHELVLAADTTVALGADLLGKPADVAEAEAMLTQLSGQSHRVLTGVALATAARVAAGLEPRVEVCSTTVTFNPLRDEEIHWYAASGEPFDKAGGYAVQGLGALFIERIDGNYSNVVGLPLPLTYRLLEEAGFPVLT